MCIQFDETVSGGTQDNAPVPVETIAQKLRETLTVGQLKGLSVIVGIGGMMLVNPLLARPAAEQAAAWTNLSEQNSSDMGEAVQALRTALDLAGVEDQFLSKEIAR